MDGAVTYRKIAFEFDRMSATDVSARTGELDRTIRQRYRGERLTASSTSATSTPPLIEGHDGPVTYGGE